MSIQLEEVKHCVNKQWETSQNASRDKLHPPMDRNWKLVLPKTFRERRALAIALWYLPEEIKYYILLELESLHPNLDFDSKGLVNSVQLNILIYSKEKMEAYLSQEIISARELFGTILQEDLRNALSNLRIVIESSRIPTRTIRRKGYRDKGTWRPPHRWIPKFDFSLTDLQNQKELKELYVKLFTLLFISKL